MTAPKETAIFEVLFPEGFPPSRFAELNQIQGEIRRLVARSESNGHITDKEESAAITARLLELAELHAHRWKEIAGIISQERGYPIKASAIKSRWDTHQKREAYAAIQGQCTPALLSAESIDRMAKAGTSGDLDSPKGAVTVSTPLEVDRMPALTPAVGHVHQFTGLPTENVQSAPEQTVSADGDVVYIDPNGKAKSNPLTEPYEAGAVEAAEEDRKAAATRAKNKPSLDMYLPRIKALQDMGNGAKSIKAAIKDEFGVELEISDIREKMGYKVKHSDAKGSGLDEVDAFIITKHSEELFPSQIADAISHKFPTSDLGRTERVVMRIKTLKAKGLI